MFLREKKKKKLRLLFHLSIFIFSAFFVIGILYIIFYSGLLNVENFEFSYSNNYSETGNTTSFFSNKFLVSSLATQVVKNKKILGYLDSDNILFWFFSGKDDLVNESILPSVKEVKLDVNLFSRRVKISVDEKNLSGVICDTKDNCYVFNEKGKVFAPAPNVSGSLILKITDTNDRHLVLGEKFLPREEWIENIIKTIEILEKNNFYLKSVLIKEISLEEWETVISVGPKFLFSLNFVPNDLEEVVQTLKKRADFSKIDYFDMRVEDRLYYK